MIHIPTTKGCTISRHSASWLSGHIYTLDLSATRAGQIARAFGHKLPKPGRELVLPKNWLGLSTLSRDHKGWYCHIDWRPM
jgi:hypothetical protein